MLRLVEEAVQDWPKMITRAEETIELLQRARQRPDGRQEEAAQARELLRWLIDNHFTFLGYREYSSTGTGTATIEPVPATGLGILRGRPGRARRVPRPAAGAGARPA